MLCIVAHYRAEILIIFGSRFGRNDDFINSFWNLPTFSGCQIWVLLFFQILWHSQKTLTLIESNFELLSLKVSKFQNEFMKSSFLPKYEPNIVRISPLYCANYLAVIPYNFGTSAWKSAKKYSNKNYTEQHTVLIKNWLQMPKYKTQIRW